MKKNKIGYGENNEVLKQINEYNRNHDQLISQMFREDYVMNLSDSYFGEIDSIIL